MELILFHLDCALVMGNHHAGKVCIRLPVQKTSYIAFMVSAKAASTASTGELDFSHELNSTMKQSTTKRKRPEHVPRAEVKICWVTFIMNPTSWLRDLSLRPAQ